MYRSQNKKLEIQLKELQSSTDKDMSKMKSTLNEEKKRRLQA